MKQEQITRAYEIARERYASIGVDTEKALAALPRIQAIMDGWESVVAAGLSEEERGRLTALLEEMTRRAAALLEERQDGKTE